MSATSSLGLARSRVGARPPGRLVRRLAAYAVSRGATEALLGVRGVLLAVLLGPAAFGTWALLRLTMRYSSLAGLSVYRGLELELLQRRSTGGEEAADRPAAAALGFVLLLAGGISGIAFAGSFAVDDPSDRLLLRGFAAASLAESLYGYALVCTRVRGNLRLYSLLETGTSAVHVIAAASLAWVWGLAGAFAGLTLANLLGIAAATRWLELRPALDLEPLRRLLKVGLPVVLTMCVGILLSTGDRWVVALWGGETMLGHYAFAGSLTTGAAALALVIRTVVFPEVYGQASSAGAATALHRHLERTLLPFAHILPPILGAVSVAVGPLITVAMPQYVEAIAPARLFLLSGAAMGLVNLASVGAVAAGRQRQLPGYALIALTLTVGLSAIALATGGALGAVAGATFAGHLLFAAQVLRLIVREAGLRDAGRFVLRTLLPLAWCALSVALSGAVFPGTDFRSAGLMLLLYLALLSVLLPIWREEWRRLRGN
jgi:O-antigen/teichoic acid export membrane protein